MPCYYNIKECYYGYLLDDCKILYSSSGGVATAISELFIEKGGRVFGVAYTDNFRSVSYIECSILAELDKLKGSKYVASNKFIQRDWEKIHVFSRVIDCLEKEIPVLFIGLGCDIGALKKYIDSKKIQSDLLTTCELICHGVVPQNVLSQFVDYIEEKYKQRITGLNMRDKIKGDLYHPMTRITLADGSTRYIDSASTDFSYAFSKALRKSCYNCRFKGQNHKGDIIIGDCWGADTKSAAYNRGRGSSILFVLTESGHEVVRELMSCGKIHIDHFDTELALKNNKNFYSSWEKYVNYNQLSAAIMSEGLHKAVIHDEGIIRYLIRTSQFIKKVKKMIPKSVKTAMKRKLNMMML